VTGRLMAQKNGSKGARTPDESAQNAVKSMDLAILR